MKSLLLTIHFGLAGIFHADKLKLSESEAESLGGAIKRVTDLYDVRIIPEKQMAWLNLCIVAGCIYVPRIRKDKKQETGKGTGNKEQGTVVQFVAPVNGDVNRNIN